MNFYSVPEKSRPWRFTRKELLWTPIIVSVLLFLLLEQPISNRTINNEVINFKAICLNSSEIGKLGVTPHFPW